ncbi:hypothetical protein [Pseudoalteromonas shioyasakiensis]|nr:hypothetical protein [Pseudoalteromonas shioyasakiensis]
MENDNKIEQLAQDLIGIKRQIKALLYQEKLLKDQIKPLYKNMVQ